ncbi:DUF3368 domain-containing protein [Algoriphagus sp. H41]|uniref:DUF3368 domain-containing protein n=1 Tax=Algoriphagus oliviformis TaxID=2811231 RepID=A0ABS3BZ07_9BACT|nr:DUF3368 domain-containing protein [Algoriphagus oliviformis]MBN7810095.1 DUF3368 domain-containing protein [Algoriphagus oliviformis]
MELLNTAYEQVIVTDIVREEFKKQLPKFLLSAKCSKADFYASLCGEIDPGEASVICLGKEISDSILILDDLKARKIAARLGMKFTGTLGVLVKAKKQGLVPEIGPYVKKLLEAGIRISPKILAEIQKDYP